MAAANNNDIKIDCHALPIFKKLPFMKAVMPRFCLFSNTKGRKDASQKFFNINFAGNPAKRHCRNAEIFSRHFWHMLEIMTQCATQSIMRFLHGMAVALTGDNHACISMV
jgi:hypothetical protein